MPSPFPGVDPFLESQGYWPDFHATFLNYWREAISDALPQAYEARIDERVQIVETDSDPYTIRPDVAVTHDPNSARYPSTTQPTQSTSTALMETMTLPLPLMDEIKETSIHILHRPDRTLVAVLELLSPSNKINPGRAYYLAKRSELHFQQVHFVELDLLIAGDRLPMGRPLPSADYYAIIARSDRRPKADVFAWTLRDPLPKIPIPLLKPDPDILIDLAQVFAIAYDRGRYARSISYTAPLSLPIDESRLRWATEKAKSL